MEITGILFFVLVITAYALVERREIRKEFYANPAGKRCWVKIESGSTTVWLPGIVEEESEQVDRLYFVRTDKGFLYVAYDHEMKPIYYSLPDLNFKL